MKNTKLLAEKYLFNTAARYFEESNELDEAVVTDARGVKYDVPDEFLKPTNTVELAGDEGEEDPDALTAVDAYEFDDDAVAAAAKAKAKAAGAAKDTARFAANTAGANAAFDALIPAIRQKFINAAKKGVEGGTIYADGEGDDAQWIVEPAYIRAVQDQVYKTVIAPAAKAAGSIKGRAIRDAWEKYIGWRETGLNKFANVRSVMRQAAAGKIAESAAIKDFHKALNECLTSMYSERYNVSLSEANKMFIINDIIAE